MLHMRDSWGKQIVASEPTASTFSRSSGASQKEALAPFAWQMTGDKKYLEQLYASQIEDAVDRQFINTEGSLWIDRIYFNTGALRRARLGGIALMRGYVYPGNAVSWKFDAPANAQSVAILIPDATPDHMKIITYNLDAVPVKAHLTGWEIDPGKWEITQGTQAAVESDPLRDVTTRTEQFERSRDVEITFPPHATTVLDLKLVSKGVPYWSRPDLGINREDVTVDGQQMKVTVHRIGAVDASPSKIVLRDRAGKVLATADAPALKAPVDLLPKTATITLMLPANADWQEGSITIESTGDLPEITQKNNRVDLR
jgi:hypothetical protein